jgi:uncharacterized membrane protein YqhA
MKKMRPLPTLIFASRWLQLPLYLGLILAQAVYVVHFWIELAHLVEAAMGSAAAVKEIAHSVNMVSPEGEGPTHLNETFIMLVVLGLIDVVMISNLLIMVTRWGINSKSN